MLTDFNVPSITVPHEIDMNTIQNSCATNLYCRVEAVLHLEIIIAQAIEVFTLLKCAGSFQEYD